MRIFKFAIIATLAPQLMGFSISSQKRQAIEKSEEIYLQLFQNDQIIDHVISSEANKSRMSLQERTRIWDTWSSKSGLNYAELGEEGQDIPEWIVGVVKNPCSEILEDTKEQYRVAELFVLDREGVPVCTANLLTQYDQRDQKSYREIAVEHKEYYIQPFTRSPHTGKRQVEVSYPLHDDDGSLIGVLVVGVKPSVR
ncbi:PDC sensor domain-containing protein [Pseudobacteriovorax antillogorgiicola]|uniref:Sensory domain of two-component sensor kinase n=1 Tax=Pseudobacteriovorax antillogorgiicola TaxID=1513793 RepID=A0A1Y6CK02_9BACT|nr:hypothetical protein [Pseudobacteriovorax antillogorgiicola]TCS46195.1 two-component sensor kinase [Pseudobacteriovorax antillogorgiicola]SMF70148.1 Sensory domain of two-component sensor kinase [Pseudobacteriovorax antillogorgiicola]